MSADRQRGRGASARRSGQQGAGQQGAGEQGAGEHSAAGPDEVLERVSQVVLAVARQVSARDVLQMIVRSARSLVGAKYAALGVPDDHGSFAEFVVDGISARLQKQIGPLPRQHGMLAVMLREGAALRLADIRADPRFEGWPSAHPELADVLAVPIRDDSQVLGFIFAACKRQPGGFTERDEQLLGLFASHAAIALTNARLYERGRELSVLEERARLARDLHDAVSQKLFSVRVKASAAAVLVERDPARAVAEIRSVAALAGQAHTELRAVIDGLAPPDLAAGGLVGSLCSYARLAGTTYGVAVRVSAAELPELSAQREAALYRVAQEALHNALRHSGARRIGVSLAVRQRRVVLEVTDDGQGFEARPPAAGLGLSSMRDRAGAVGGTLTIRSAPGAGTRVRLSVPAGEPPAAEPPADELLPGGAS
jgi:signal transduction histidine kinase